MQDQDLSSERIERAALESLHQCCPEDTREILNLDLVEVDDGVVAVSGGDPSILINRTLGLGTRMSTTAAAIDKVAAVYTEHAVTNYFIHLYDDSLTNDAIELLSGTRFSKKRGWMKFAQANPQPRTAATSLRVEEIGSDKGKDFGKIVCTAFGMGEQSIPLMAGLANDERWHLFVTYDEDTPAGAGALFVEGKCGWLEWGATDPAFRRRGSQAAIMARRLTLANELGCEYIFTETGEAVEGDPQHSYKNILKAGFQESILRQNWCLSSA